MSVQTANIKPMIIGLTGGIASGKSTATHIFRAHQIPVIDSDQIVHDLWNQNKTMVEQIEHHFGFSMAMEGRKKLAQLIFDHADLRQALNAIVHPYVFDKIEQEKIRHDLASVILIDMPLLFEVNYQDQCDEVCLVYVDLKTQIERLMKRDNLTSDEAMKRIQSQMSMDHKKELADVIFDNRQTITDLEDQIESYLRGLLNEE